MVAECFDFNEVRTPFCGSKTEFYSKVLESFPADAEKLKSTT
jgi:hypothetical protein